MLDIKFVRENPDVVKENMMKKFEEHKVLLVNEVLQEDKELRQAQQHADDLRTQRKKISKQIGIITEALNKTGNKIFIRPETTGKATQWGDLEEIINLSKEYETVFPCVDFSHLHARYVGIMNTYDEFCGVFEKIGKELGDFALNNFHAHLAGIE